ncbi:MAG: hypothetical protein IBX55_20410 [Methyloprofundus sp.]|nr:hypothetical protein [Methyloprofundus sp.]
MKEILKLNKIVSSLEDQAKQVTEFNGLLTSINEVRVQLDSNKAQLYEATKAHERLIKDNRDNSKQLENKITGFEKQLDAIVREQLSTSERIGALDILSPKDFSKGLRASDKTIIEHLSRLYQRIETIEKSQQMVRRNSYFLLLLYTLSMLGVFYLLVSS